MKRPAYELFWEDIAERVVYAELDDLSWQLAEETFGYHKERSLYIYHQNKLAAFFSTPDSNREAQVGYRFYKQKRNVEQVLALKSEALVRARSFVKKFHRTKLKTLSDKELQQLLIQTLDMWHYALCRHFLSQPQFFRKFEERTKLGNQQSLWIKKIGDYRLHKTRVAFALIWDLCRKAFREYASRLGISPAEAESIRYNELKEGRINKAVLRARAQAFVITSHRHRLRIYTGAAVGRYIKKYENYGTVKQLTGIVGNRGYAAGRAFVIKNENLNFRNLPTGMRSGMILIVQNAWPELNQYYKKAAAIVTNEGGITSHGAVVARELGIPCIVGTRIATKVFKTGDLVEVDAKTRIIKKAG